MMYLLNFKFADDEDFNSGRLPFVTESDDGELGAGGLEGDCPGSGLSGLLDILGTAALLRCEILGDGLVSILLFSSVIKS